MAALAAAVRVLSVSPWPLLPRIVHHDHLRHLHLTRVQLTHLGQPQLQQPRGHKRWLRAYLALQARMERKFGKPSAPLRRDRDNFDLASELSAFCVRVGQRLPAEGLARAMVSPCYGHREAGGHHHHGELAQDGARLAREALDGTLARGFPDMPEEGRAALRAFLLSDETLGEVSRGLGLSQLVLSAGDPPANPALAGALLAVLGLVGAGGGAGAAQDFLQSFVLPQLGGSRDLFSLWPVRDPMRALCEEMERRGRGAPEPRLTRTAGAASALPCYVVTIYSDRRPISESAGETPLVAEEEAARGALRALYGFPAPAASLARPLAPRRVTQRAAS